ncbi:MAG: hypothetical protein Q7S63_03090 [bacterium]|nr:hypothetical protein [bacterium]
MPIYYCVDGDRYVGVLSAQVAASSTGEDRYSFIGTLFGDDYRSIKISNGKVGDFALPDDSLFALVL